MDKTGLYLGIDPGMSGGAGVLDSQGQYVDAWRWDKRNPLTSWHKLMKHSEHIRAATIEIINPFSGLHGRNFMALAENSGAWKMMLILLDIAWGEVYPATWQAATGLRHWKKAWETDKTKPCPLSLARIRWPEAGLRFQADDGMAVGLILADLAREAHLSANSGLSAAAGEAIS